MYMLTIMYTRYVVLILNSVCGGSFRVAAGQIFKNVNLTGAGDLLARSFLARGIAKCMYSRLSKQTLRPGRFDEQREDCIKAKARLGSGRGEGRLMCLRCGSRVDYSIQTRAR